MAQQLLLLVNMKTRNRDIPELIDEREFNQLVARRGILLPTDDSMDDSAENTFREVNIGRSFSDETFEYDDDPILADEPAEYPF